MAYAHRISWALAFGPIPPDALVLHACDNPACVNPSHLFLGDQRANMQDCAEKGRWRNQARFNLETAREIRARYRRGGVTQGELAAEFGMSFQHVSSIVNHKRWGERTK